MAVRTGRSEQPKVLLIEYSDPTAVGRDLDLLAQDAVQLQPGPLRARCVIVRLGAISVVFHSTQVRLRTRTSTRQDQIAYVAFGPAAVGTVDGLPVRPDLLLAVEPGAEAGFVAEPGWETVTFLFTPELVREHLGTHPPARPFRMPRGLEVLCADAARVQRLFEWGRRLADAGAEGSLPLDRFGEHEASVREALVDAMLETVRGATPCRPSRRELAGMNRHRIVKTAEAYALSRVGERLYVSDLCRAAAVGERTLEYAFKATTGLTPTEYLTALRLHRARASLQRAPRRARSVSATAFDWGFRHLGEFAQAYRQRFGELPSQTRPLTRTTPTAIERERQRDETE